MLTGLLAGALGGAARAGGQIADRAIQARDAQAQREANMADFQARMEFEMDRRLQAENALAEREQRAFESAREGGRALGRQQDALGLIGLAQQVGGDSPQMSQQEIESLLAENPHYRQVYEAAGYLSPRKASEQMELESQAAMTGAAPATVRRALSERADKMRTAERQAASDARQERLDDERQQRDDARLALQERNTAAAEKRAEVALRRAEGAGRGSGGGGSAAERGPKPDTTLDLERRIDTAMNHIAFELGVEPNRVASQVRSLQRRAETGNTEAAATLERIQPMLARYNDLALRMAQVEQQSQTERGGAGRVSAAPPAATTTPSASQRPAPATVAPQSANVPPVSLLKPGHVTTFANGQKWILRDGRPEQVK